MEIRFCNRYVHEKEYEWLLLVRVRRVSNRSVVVDFDFEGEAKSSKMKKKEMRRRRRERRGI